MSLWSFVLILLFSLSLFLLPDRFWLKFDCFHSFIFPSWLFNFFRKSKASLLLTQLGHIESDIKLGLVTHGRMLDQFSYFTILIEKLLELSARWGSDPQKALQRLRKGIYVEERFEQKVRKNFFEALLQCFFIAAVIWSFILFSQYLMDLRPSSKMFIFMIFWQLLGIFSFVTFFGLLYHKMFTSFDRVFESLFVFSSLVRVGLPLQNLLQLCHYQEMLHLDDSKFTFIASRFTHLVEILRSKGLCDEQEVQELIEETFSLRELQFKRFLQFLKLSLFGHLALFFLSSYFMALTSFFSALLAI